MLGALIVAPLVALGAQALVLQWFSGAGIRAAVVALSAALGVVLGAALCALGPGTHPERGGVGRLVVRMTHASRFVVETLAPPKGSKLAPFAKGRGSCFPGVKRPSIAKRSASIAAPGVPDILLVRRSNASTGSMPQKSVGSSSLPTPAFCITTAGTRSGWLSTPA